MKVKVGDNVMISPEVTNKDDWEKGKVIDGTLLLMAYFNWIIFFKFKKIK